MREMQVRMPAVMYGALEAQARVEGRSVNQAVVNMVRRHLALLAVLRERPDLYEPFMRLRTAVDEELGRLEGHGYGTNGNGDEGAGGGGGGGGGGG